MASYLEKALCLSAISLFLIGAFAANRELSRQADDLKKTRESVDRTSETLGRMIESRKTQTIDEDSRRVDLSPDLEP